MGAAVWILSAMFFAQATTGDAPKDVVDFFRSIASTLADANSDGSARAFLDHFDTAMPDYATFSAQIETMIGAGEVSTSIDFINTDGNDQKRTMDLDWLLLCDGESAKRAVVKCTIEKRGKKWKITSIAPVEFFKRN